MRMRNHKKAVDVQTREVITGDRKYISDAVARYIASQWYSGQSSALCAFSSTGAITNADVLRAEITRHADFVSSDTDAYGEDSFVTEYGRLIALDTYVSRWKRSRKPIMGWHTLWP